MALAIRLAEKGLNTSTPNPRVGCVLVSPKGDIIAEGFHFKAGEGHAEVKALKAAGEKAIGSTVYVTLEPCNHSGRTGACSEALIKAGVAEVVFAMKDPNPLVAGAGLQRLRDAGIKVRGPVLEAEANALNPGFIKRMIQQRPFVRCKLAMSLDGRTAMASGESQWITGKEARLDVQKLRAQSCAIVTGVGTVLGDDPSMTVRNEQDLSSNIRQPLRVILDNHLRIPETAKILHQPGKTAIATTSLKREPIASAEIWGMPSKSGAVDLDVLLNRLAQEECNEVLVEAGPTLAGSFLKAGLVDELIIYMAPKLLGSLAKPLFELPLDLMTDAVELNIIDITPVGKDWRIRARA